MTQTTKNKPDLKAVSCYLGGTTASTAKGFNPLPLWTRWLSADGCPLLAIYVENYPFRGILDTRADHSITSQEQWPLHWPRSRLAFTNCWMPTGFCKKALTCYIGLTKILLLALCGLGTFLQHVEKRHITTNASNIIIATNESSGNYNI